MEFYFKKVDYRFINLIDLCLSYNYKSFGKVVYGKEMFSFLNSYYYIN